MTLVSPSSLIVKFLVRVMRGTKQVAVWETWYKHGPTVESAMDWQAERARFNCDCPDWTIIEVVAVGPEGEKLHHFYVPSTFKPYVIPEFKVGDRIVDVNEQTARKPQIWTGVVTELHGNNMVSANQGVWSDGFGQTERTLNIDDPAARPA